MPKSSSKLFGRNTSRLPSIRPQEAWERLTEDVQSYVLIDVREHWEFQWRHVRGSHNIPLSQFRKRLDEVPVDREVLLLCLSGHRSIVAGKMLQGRDSTRVVNIRGGVIAWLRHRLPMEVFPKNK